MGEKEEKGRGKRIILLEKELRGMGGGKGFFWNTRRERKKLTK